MVRDPPEATPRYTRWLTSLTPAQLHTQFLKEATVLLPTWFMARATFDAVGPFEPGVYNAEDLRLFYALTARGARLAKVPRPLLTYR